MECCFVCKGDAYNVVDCGCSCENLKVHIDCLEYYNRINKRYCSDSITCSVCNSYFGTDIRNKILITEEPPRKLLSEFITKNANIIGYSAAIIVFINILTISILKETLYVKNNCNVFPGLCVIDDIKYERDYSIKNILYEIPNNETIYLSSKNLYGNVKSHISTEFYDFTSRYDKINCVSGMCIKNITKECNLLYCKSDFKTLKSYNNEEYHKFNKKLLQIGIWVLIMELVLIYVFYIDLKIKWKNN